MEPTGRVDLQQQPKSHPQIAPSPSQPMRPRRWLKFFLAAAILILVGIAMLPQIVAWSPLRHDLPRSRLKGFEGGIRVGSASLSWWGPTVLNDLELDAPDGKPFCRVRQVTEDCTVWGSLFRRTEPLHVLIEDPQLTVVLRDDGSNVEDAFGPVLAHPGHVLRQRTSKVTGAIVRIVDPATGAETNYQNGSVDAVSDAEDGSANRISVRAESIDSQPAANVELAARWPSRNSNGAAASRELSLRAVDLPLAGTEPLIRRLGSDVSLSGTVSGHVDCNSTGPPDDSHSQAMTGVWELKCHNLRIRSPSRIGTETLSPGPTDFRGRVTRAGLNIRIEDLHIKTDFSQIDGGIAILLDDSPAMPDAGGSATASSPKDLDLLGELDLVALTRLLPQSLGLREGAELKEGRVRFEIASRTEQSAPRWNGRLETSRIAALFGGEEVAWDQPLDVSFAAHRNRGRLEIDSIESQSDVFTLRGQATDSGLHLEAGCDLAKLATRLGQFVKTDGVELQGTLAAAADFTRDPAGDLVIESRGTAENLILRRQITRMIERRAGDLQPAIESAPPDPRSGAPPTVAPRNRKEMNSQRKAERQARQEARRRERIAHRQANQIVEIPVQEWQTVWTEPRFELTCQTRVDFSRRRLDITRLNVTSDGFQLRGTGSIAEIPSRCMLDLGGEIECDAERLVERVREVVGPFVHIAGHDTRQFSITGPLRGGPSALPGPPPVVPLELAASGGADWKGANLFGLPAGPGTLDCTLAEGVFAARPIDMALGSGKLKLGPRIVLTGRPVVLVIPGGPVIEGVELTDQFCDGWLKFIAPILSQATRCSGRFSLDVDESHLLLFDPAAGDLTGRLHIERGEVLPGPLFDEINNLIGGIISGVGVAAPQDLLGLDHPLVQIAQQRVEFELHEGRIHHAPMEFYARGVVIRTRGSVGLDQSLDLVASISLSDDLLSRARLLGALKGQALEIPISGTLRRPRLDPRAAGRLAEQLGQNVLDKLLNGGLQKLFDRND